MACALTATTGSPRLVVEIAAMLPMDANSTAMMAIIMPYIDWSPFFRTWELKGKYPKILDDPEYGEAARTLFDDAQGMLSEIVAEQRLTARAVYGFWPAASRRSYRWGWVSERVASTAGTRLTS